MHFTPIFNIISPSNMNIVNIELVGNNLIISTASGISFCINARLLKDLLDHIDDPDYNNNLFDSAIFGVATFG